MSSSAWSIYSLRQERKVDGYFSSASAAAPATARTQSMISAKSSAWKPMRRPTMCLNLRRAPTMKAGRRFLSSGSKVSRLRPRRRYFRVFCRWRQSREERQPEPGAGVAICQGNRRDHSWCSRPRWRLHGQGGRRRLHRSDCQSGSDHPSFGSLSGCRLAFAWSATRRLRRGRRSGKGFAELGGIHQSSFSRSRRRPQ